MENARKTAELLNKTEPCLFFTGTIHADPGCPLYDRMQSGDFSENSLGEYLEEEEAFLNALDARDCLYFGLHPSNVVGLYGNLKHEKQNMLRQLQQKRKELTPDQLRSIPRRGGEGMILP